MRVAWAVVIMLGGLSACSFAAPGLGDGSTLDPDAPTTSDVAHLDDALLIEATAPIVFSVAATIDTQTMTMTPPLPSGAQFHLVPQQGGGPMLAVLEVTAFSELAGLTITGDKPLVIVAATSITFSGDVDLAGHGERGGPGSRATGGGVGGTPTHAGGYVDGGGGGGGYGTVGGLGGTATDNSNVGLGGSPGMTFGTATLAVLEGGAAGGPGLRSTGGCTPARGGGGGGALQLSAHQSITITANVYATGGGGGGGVTCTNVGSAGGGGSGGAIYLQAPNLPDAVRLHVEGGGGGSGGNYSNGIVAGEPGQNGANGGAGGGAKSPDGSAGGAGATAVRIAVMGDAIASWSGNGGGGGGGMGRTVTDSTPF